MMTPEEKDAWNALIYNRMNPSNWEYVATRAHDRRDPPVVTHEFKSKLTKDIVQIMHVDPGAKKKKWRIFQ